MSGKRRKKRKKNRAAVLIVEIIVLVILSIVLIVCIRGTQLLGLINRYNTDDSKLKTSSEANQNEVTDSSGTDEQNSSQNTSETTQLTGYEVIALVGLDTRTGGDSGDDDYSQNSDTMIICVIDHNNKAIRLCSIYRDTYLNIGEDYYGNPNRYTKCNAAYNLGGPEQFLSMVNLNLDLNITEFVTVDFASLTKCIDLLGGLDIDMTREEVIHTNNYNVETAAAAGVEYEELELPDDDNFDGSVTRTFHCNGSQSVSYARIRYTTGNDFRRASRQREVLSLIKDKASTADLLTLNNVLEAVLPSVTTNMDSASIMSLATNVLSYDMGDDNMKGFPFVHNEGEEVVAVMGVDCVIPVTLEYNVQQLHEFLFPGEAYSPSAIVQEYSANISNDSGLTSDDIEYYSQIYDYSALEGISEEDYLAQQNTSEENTW